MTRFRGRAVALRRLGGTALLLLGVAACGDDGATTPTPAFVIRGPEAFNVVVGDSVALTITPSDVGPLEWSSSAPTIAAVEAGAVVALRPGTAQIVASYGGTADTVSVTVTSRPNGYTADEIDYFAEIALGFEYGGASQVVRRWDEPIRYRVNGVPDAEDLASLDRVVAEVNALTSTVDMVEVSENPLVEIHFAPVSDFPDILPTYVPGNIGYFAIWYSTAYRFTRAVVLIASDRDRDVRDHLIREEVTQILGLGRDSERYPQSIFYQRWSLVSEYAPVDRALVEMLYRPEVQPGMDENAVSAVLRRLTRGVTDSPAAASAAGGGGWAPLGIRGEAGVGAGGSGWR